ncbi:MAG TPA: hypothetical protein PKB09_02060 [Candidatus Saccharibacteria bacterium]|nr:hypothetical protein [Candidatus Saccharibacteria bacterium]
MKKLVIISFIVAAIIFLLLPSRSEELYRCPDGSTVCPALYSSETKQFTGMTLYGLLTPDNEADDQTYSDLARNSLIFIPPFILLSVYLYNKRKTHK